MYVCEYEITRTLASTRTQSMNYLVVGRQRVKFENAVQRYQLRIQFIRTKCIGCIASHLARLIFIFQNENKKQNKIKTKNKKERRK